MFSSCMESPDKVIIYDGIDDKNPILLQLCEIWNGIEVTSTGHYMLIQFMSNGFNQMKGFAATYKFEKLHPSTLTPNPGGEYIVWNLET